MGRCKNCGEEVEVKEVVREVERRVEIGYGAYWLRFWRLAFLVTVLLAAILAVGIGYADKLETERWELLIRDPNITIEVQELPGTKPIRKFTRLRR